MRRVISLVLLAIVALGITLSLLHIPFGEHKTKVGEEYLQKGKQDTGAVNIVTSVVVNYRGFDTLGEVTVLFVSSIGVSAVLASRRKKVGKKVEPASLVLFTGCRFLFPLILFLGAYIIVHGHLTPGGGFQGGAVIASVFLLMYLGCRGRRVSEVKAKVTESLGGLVFVIVGLTGLAIGGHYFLSNYMPKGTLFSLISAGIIPIIYVAIGFKVGSELTSIIGKLIEESK